MREGGGFNLACFCGGDPVGKVDPWGLASFLWGDLGVPEGEEAWTPYEVPCLPPGGGLPVFVPSRPILSAAPALAGDAPYLGSIGPDTRGRDRMFHQATCGQYPLGSPLAEMAVETACRVGASYAVPVTALSVAAASDGNTLFLDADASGDDRIGAGVSLALTAATAGLRFRAERQAARLGSPSGAVSRDMLLREIDGMVRGPMSLPSLEAMATAGGMPRTVAPLSLREPYAGVRQASQYLRDMGVSRSHRVRYIQSFDVRTLSVRTAGDATYGFRFHDFGVTARPMGQTLTDTFTHLTDRVHLALPPEWNNMTGMAQWQIKPGTTYLYGRVAPQLSYGSQYIGGANQLFVLEPWKYQTLLAP